MDDPIKFDDVPGGSQLVVDVTPKGGKYVAVGRFYDDGELIEGDYAFNTSGPMRRPMVRDHDYQVLVEIQFAGTTSQSVDVVASVAGRSDKRTARSSDGDTASEAVMVSVLP